MSSSRSSGVYQSVTPDAGPQRPGWAVPLSKEALFRIQLSLASRRSSVMVLETVCRIFTGTLMQQETPMRVQDLDPNDTDWSYQTTGVPGLLVEYRDIKDMSIFSLKLVVIEVESGLCTWEGKFGGAANYQVFAEDFHTFWLPGLGQVGIEFGDVSEGERMRVLLREWLDRLKTSALLLAQQEADNSLKKKKKKPSVISRSDSQPRFDKRQISTPCNFIHVSGITMTRTQECEKELQGSVRRFFRGAVSSLTRTNTISPGSKVRSALLNKTKLTAASSLGDLSGDTSKRSLPNGSASPEFEAVSQRTESTFSDGDSKFSSLPRKKKGTSSRSQSPAPSEISVSAASQHVGSLNTSAVDNITPNSRRKAIVHSRVITSDDYNYQQEQPQRRSTASAPPDRSRLEQRKYSAPNIRSQFPFDHPEVWRQYSQYTNQSDAMYGRPSDSHDQSAAYNLKNPVSDNLPPYTAPPPAYPAHQSDHSVPQHPSLSIPAGLRYPQDTEPYLPPPIPHSVPPSSHPFAPPVPMTHEAGLRPSRHGRARVSERRDLKRLSNSYTSFGHVGSTQVDV